MMMDQALIPFSILLSSFLGSWHCAGMCGPFAALTGSRGQLWQYHLGRFFVYSLLGALSGYFGEFILKSEMIWLRSAGAFLLGLSLIGLGLQYFFQGKPHGSGFLFQKVFRLLRKFQWHQSGWALGILAGFLPCMWLYTYVIAAAATKSPWSGSLVLALFWLGGLPALSAVSLLVKSSIQKSAPYKQKIAGVVMIFAGIYALGSHLLFAA